MGATVSISLKRNDGVEALSGMFRWLSWWSSELPRHSVAVSTYVVVFLSMTR
jgi:hypothetical protein